MGTKTRAFFFKNVTGTFILSYLTSFVSALTHHHCPQHPPSLLASHSGGTPALSTNASSTTMLHCPMPVSVLKHHTWRNRIQICLDYFGCQSFYVTLKLMEKFKTIEDASDREGRGITQYYSLQMRTCTKSHMIIKDRAINRVDKFSTSIMLSSLWHITKIPLAVCKRMHLHLINWSVLIVITPNRAKSMEQSFVSDPKGAKLRCLVVLAARNSTAVVFLGTFCAIGPGVLLN
ncbi:unnamed protein product [Lactuca saligna]|uniref:Uncharacterized protein n=1 Tax=Lactuca saligna TaxID=75948 RepID=A0AA35YWX4_LACSI|nr:unnamed protein product [Lactuca saligna]